MTREYGLFTLSLVVIASCKSASPDTKTQQSLGSEEPAAFGITGGNTANSAAKHTVAILPFNGSNQLLGVGTGFFAADRCVLTVAHNFDGTANGGQRSALVLQTTGAGMNVMDPNTKAPREMVLRVSKLPNAASPKDLAFAWIERRAQDDPNNPRILIYDSQTPAYTIPNVPTKHKIYGFGGGAQGTVIQKSGLANATTVGRLTTQLIPDVQLNNTESGILFSVADANNAGTQPGDSGGPIFGTDSGPIAVIEGGLSDPETNAPIGDSGLLFAPFQPWVERHLAKFCKPVGGVGVSRTQGFNVSANVQLTVSGGAFFKNGYPWEPGVTESQSVLCTAVTSSVCGSSLRADDPLMANLDITATVTAPSGYVVEWPANVCNGAPSGTAYRNASCTWTYKPEDEGSYESVTYKLLSDSGGGYPGGYPGGGGYPGYP